jgi:hypothetical protein
LRFGGRWRCCGARSGLGGILHVEQGGDDVAHVAEFAFGKKLRVYAGPGEKNELAEIAEGGGAAGGDAVGAKGFEDTFEGAMHIDAGIGSGKAGAELGGNVGLFGSAKAAVELGVGAAEVAVGGGHAALASVGEFKVAKIVRIVLASHSGERIANVILMCQYNGIIIYGTKYPLFE